MENRVYILTALVLSSFGAFGQNHKAAKAEKHYDAYSFAEAIEVYEGMEEKDVHSIRKLADSYFKVGKYVQAEEVYQTLVASEERTSEDVLNYSSVLRINKKYEEAEKWMEEFHQSTPEDSRGKEFNSNKGFYKRLRDNSGVFIIRNLSINTDQQDFAPTYCGKDKVVFASSRTGTKMAKREWNWNQKPFLDVFVADALESNNLSEPVEFSAGINKKYHEGPAAFNKAGDMMVLTRNNYGKKGADDVVKLKLFIAHKNAEGEWSEPESMAFNSPDYSVGHASLTLDGKRMYFASDMPGGLGGVDIYFVDLKEDGSWTAPQNMGPVVNTEGNEMFPFVHDSGILFFASDGHIGLGGLDVFVSTMNKEGGVKRIENLGSPINSNKDDFALILNPEQTNGFFSSNRDGGKGDDDIYAFRMNEPIKYDPYIDGFAFDFKTFQLPETEVVLRNVDTGEEVARVVSNEEGYYSFDAQWGVNYEIIASKDGYFDGITEVYTTEDIYEVRADVTLEKDLGLALNYVVTDVKTMDPIEGVHIHVTTARSGLQEEFVTDVTGEFKKKLTDEKRGDKVEYLITLSKDGYLPNSLSITKHFTRTGVHTIWGELQIQLIPIEVGDDLGQLIALEDIYFDFDKANIRPDAAIELDKIVEVMNDAPNLVIELGSHTDCRGDDKYNQILSEKRAKSSAAYIKARISNPERISGKGYGESQPVNDCGCGKSRKESECTEEEHQLNRRTEFRIVEMD